MTDLSPVAQAVLEASNLLPGKDSYLILAAALRAATEQIETLYCDGDVEDSPGIVFALRQLMIIADELEKQAYEL
jgi:hypothetical protein